MDRRERRRRERERKRIEEKIKKETLQPQSQETRATPQSPLPKRYLGLAISRTWAVIVSVSVLISLLLSYFAFRPDLSVEPYKMLDTRNPFSEQFTVQNNSLYTLYDVKASCVFDSMRARGNTFESSSNGIAIVANELSPKESTTIDCPDIIYGIDYADITIAIRFRRWFWPKKNSFGNVDWFHRPTPSGYKGPFE